MLVIEAAGGERVPRNLRETRWISHDGKEEISEFAVVWAVGQEWVHTSQLDEESGISGGSV